MAEKLRAIVVDDNPAFLRQVERGARRLRAWNLTTAGYNDVMVNRHVADVGLIDHRFDKEDRGKGMGDTLACEDVVHVLQREGARVALFAESAGWEVSKTARDLGVDFFIKPDEDRHLAVHLSGILWKVWRER